MGWAARKQLISQAFDDAQGAMVLPDRIELSTSPLPRECSTTELRQPALVARRLTAIGAGAVQASERLLATVTRG